MTEQQPPNQPDPKKPETEATDQRKGQDKAWPPKNLESKTPKTETK